MLSRRVIILLLKAAFSIALIVLVARRVDLGAVWLRLSTVKLGLVAVAGALIVFQVVVGSERWRAIITAQGARVHSAITLRIYYIGVFFNMCTPGGLFGDVVRIWHAHRAGLAIPLAASSVILDRVVVAVSLVVATASMQYLLPATVRSQFQIGGVIDVFSLAALASIVGLAALMLLDRLPAALLARGPLRGLPALSLSARLVLLRPNAFIPIMVLAVFS
jgi:glycosyltransferase 2 family protein